MIKNIEVSQEMKEMFKAAFKEATDAAEKAQVVVEFAGAKRKAFEDLVSMYCLANNLDRRKLRVDSQTLGMTYEEEEKQLKL